MHGSTTVSEKTSGRTNNTSLSAFQYKKLNTALLQSAQRLLDDLHKDRKLHADSICGFNWNFYSTTDVFLPVQWNTFHPQAISLKSLKWQTKITVIGGIEPLHQG